jgi:hypothetical protein
MLETAMLMIEAAGCVIEPSVFVSMLTSIKLKDN